MLPSILPSAVELVELLKRSEGKTLEFKRKLSSPDGALKTIVAFAKTSGGTLLAGLEDWTRRGEPGKRFSDAFVGPASQTRCPGPRP